MNTKTRRDFLKVTGLATAFTFLPVTTSKGIKVSKKNQLKLGLASYSLRKFSRDETIEMTKRVGLDHICFKSMHLPLETPDIEIKNIAKSVKDTGLYLYGGGVIYMKNKSEIDQAFEYAKNAGMSLIVGVPDPDLLDYTNERIKQYNIKVAIHNHGPGDEKYPGPKSIYDKVKDLDPRFGICMDIGHTQRIGVNPTEAGNKYFSRILDIHIKDVDSATAEGKTVEIGRGVIDIPGFLKMLIDKGYDGIVSFEYEKDAEDPLPGLSESVGYVKGCLDSISCF